MLTEKALQAWCRTRATDSPPSPQTQSALKSPSYDSMRLWGDLGTRHNRRDPGDQEGREWGGEVWRIKMYRYQIPTIHVNNIYHKDELKITRIKMGTEDLEAEGERWLERGKEFQKEEAVLYPCSFSVGWRQTSCTNNFFFKWEKRNIRTFLYLLLSWKYFNLMFIKCILCASNWKKSISPGSFISAGDRKEK